MGATSPEEGMFNVHIAIDVVLAPTSDATPRGDGCVRATPM